MDVTRNKEKTSDWKRYLFHLCLNLAVMALFVLLFRPFFETNDDASIIHMVDGSKGIRDPHIVFENVILGWIYIFLYRITAALPWYTMVQYGILWLSMGSITYVLCSLPVFENQRRAARAGKILLCAGFWFFAGYEAYVLIQFTRTAGFAAIGGTLLLLFFAGRDKRQIFEAAAGMLLLTLAFLLRWKQALLCIAMLSGIGLQMLLVFDKACRKRLLRRTVCVMLAAAAVFGATYYTDRCAYESEQWQSYLQFNRERGQLLDFGLPSYKTNQEVYHSLDIYKVSFDLLRTWNFADPQVYTTQVFHQLNELRDQTAGRKKGLSDFLADAGEALVEKRIFYFALLSLALALAAAIARRRAALLLVPAYAVLLFLGAYYYIYLRGRFDYQRVDVPILTAVAIVLLWCAGNAAGKERREGTAATAKKGRALLCTAICGAALCVSIICAGTFADTEFTDSLRWSEEAQDREEQVRLKRSLLQEVVTDPEHLYVCKVGTLTDTNSFGVFSRAWPGELSRILWLGGWDIYTAGYLDIMNRYGITNPYRDLADRDDILLVDGQIDKTLLYLNKHYGGGIKAQWIRDIGGFGIYHIYTEN